MAGTTTTTTAGPAVAPRRGASSFYFVMSLLLAGIVVLGFSQTIDDSLIRPKLARPWLLYLHAALMVAWMALFVAQATLVRVRNVRQHRRLGLAWLVVGATIAPVGVATAIVMRRFDIDHLHATLSFIAVPLGDMVMFTACFLLAAVWRRRPEYHRRLMFMATCALMSAGLGRFPIVPDAWFDAGWFYAAIDGLIVAAMVRDLVVLRRVHPVLSIGLPLFMVTQLGVWLLWRHPSQPWLTFLRSVVGAG